MIDRQQYLEQFGKNFVAGLKLTETKNADYANEQDPFENFRDSAHMAGVTVERGILVRLGDKFKRVSNLLDRDAVVADEKITDTLLDLMVYANILLTFIQLENIQQQAQEQFEEELALASNQEMRQRQDIMNGLSLAQNNTLRATGKRTLKQLFGF